MNRLSVNPSLCNRSAVGICAGPPDGLPARNGSPTSEVITQLAAQAATGTVLPLEQATVRA